MPGFRRDGNITERRQQEEKLRVGANLANGKWRQGAKLGRTLYIDDVCIGMVDHPDIAKAIVEVMNNQHRDRK